jgi:hypothetical protein
LDLQHHKRKKKRKQQIFEKNSKAEKCNYLTADGFKKCSMIERIINELEEISEENIKK